MEHKTFKIELSEQDIQIIVKSLSQQPYAIVAELIAKLHSQIQSQLNSEH